MSSSKERNIRTQYNGQILIISMQEVEMAAYENQFKDHFTRAGYDSIFFPKTRAKTMTEKERCKVDGCATFYRASR